MVNPENCLGLRYNKIRNVTAFAFNAKSFAIASLVRLILFFFLVTFSGRTAKSFSVNWMLLHVKQYKNCCWRTFVIRKCIYLHSAGWWWSSYVPTDLLSTNELVSTNRRANKSCSRSSFTRSILAQSRCNEQKTTILNAVFSRKKWKKENGSIQPITPVYELCCKMG